MDLDQLGTPAQLWRRWVLLAAGHAGVRRAGFEVRRSDGSALLGDDVSWLRLRRLGGNRAVLWGRHDDLPVDDSFVDVLRDEAPDWSYDVDSAYAAAGVGFLGWHAHGSWSSVPSRVPGPVADLLAPLSCEENVVRWWRSAWPDATEDDLAAALADPEGPAMTTVAGGVAASRAARQVALGRTWASRQLSDAATVHLRGEIHAQMRGSTEIADRGHPARPPLLRQWARVNAPAMPFSHAVCALGPSASPVMVATDDDHGLTEPQARSLDNVLMELRMSETHEASGAWLFARVSGTGRSASLDRRFDSWPSWYDAPTGPTMAALHAEMAQRTPRWRPSWAALLPTDRF